MKSRTKLLLTIIVIVVVIIVLLVGSLLMYKHKKERQLVKDLDKTIFNVYPIKNLEDFYNIEGYKDENFDKQDKNVVSEFSHEYPEKRRRFKIRRYVAKNK